MLESLLPIDGSENSTGNNNGNSNNNATSSGSSSGSSSISINSILSIDGGGAVSQCTDGRLSRTSSLTSRSSLSSGNSNSGHRLLFNINSGSNSTIRYAATTDRTTRKQHSSNNLNNVTNSSCFFGAYAGGSIGGGYQYSSYQQFNHSLQTRLHNLTNTAIVTTGVTNANTTTTSPDSINSISYEEDLSNSNLLMSSGINHACDSDIEYIDEDGVDCHSGEQHGYSSLGENYNNNNRDDPVNKKGTATHHLYRSRSFGTNSRECYGTRADVSVGRQWAKEKKKSGPSLWNGGAQEDGPLGIMMAFTRTLSRRYNIRWAIGGSVGEQ